MSARRMMTMRALVERDTQVATDAYGHKAVPSWTSHIASLACRMWFEVERHILDGDKTAALEDRKVIVPKGTDIKPGDRIANVKDRRGNIVFTGPAIIDAVGTRRDHIVVSLLEVT